MKIFRFTSLTFALLHCANSFIKHTNVLLRYSLFCNNPKDNDEKKEGEPSKISIKSVTDMFNKYLAIEQEQYNISDMIVLPPRNKTENPEENKKEKEEKATSTNDLLLTTNYDRLTDIQRNIKRKQLLKILQNDKTSQQTKLEYIDDAKWLFDREYSVNMSNGGLMNDWNFTL